MRVECSMPFGTFYPIVFRICPGVNISAISASLTYFCLCHHISNVFQNHYTHHRKVTRLYLLPHTRNSDNRNNGNIGSLRTGCYSLSSFLHFIILRLMAARYANGSACLKSSGLSYLVISSASSSTLYFFIRFLRCNKSSCHPLR